MDNVDPRVQALTEALGRLNTEDVELRWAAVVDHDGLILANYPPDDSQSMDQAVASTSHILRMGERAQQTVEFGKWRYTMMSGALFQELVMHLTNEIVLTVGVGSQTALHKIFAAVRNVVPILIRSLDLSARTSEEPNTMIMRRTELDRHIEEE
jgi:predicted regulator of Ras-like GTPase activity (Roadblock/LC7/MglB family)